MEIELKFTDFVKLAAKGEISKGDHKIRIGRPILPKIRIASDGSSSYVHFKLDESDPRAKQQGSQGCGTIPF